MVSCGTSMHKDDIPDRLGFNGKHLEAVEGWINPGDSVIVDPDGRIVAGPAREEETILYAELDPAKITGPRWQLDIAGHYAHPDIFDLIVHRKPKPLLAVSADGVERDSDRAESNDSAGDSRAVGGGAANGILSTP